MNWIVQNLWLIPALPLLAAGITALLPQRQRSLSAALAVGSMVLAFALSCIAFFHTLGADHGLVRETFKFTWFQMGGAQLELGWILDPLTACMLVMVTFVGSLIFIYSIGYMAHDMNFTRFFCFLSLFAAAMLGLIIANNLLLFFICWELVGLASYLLIGFWYHKPSAAAAAKKAFITTRIGDIGFFLGLLWLYAETGTLVFYDGGAGCLEQSALTKLVGQTTGLGMMLSTIISLLIFCGPIGKSGQLPLHVWLPDAMEGPTPVSALIHAATMVAAGVFLVARVYPLMAATSLPAESAAIVSEVHAHGAVSTALQMVTWVGALTAVFAALIAVAQTDIKRVLAYSTVSQLGYMMMGLGVGGVAVGMFHLLTHAFFKALLFLGAGSVIHGCHEEQDIRRMGGLRKLMPVTFATYAIGMMALAGVPLFFSGFWSKDEILHAAWLWEPSKWPLILGVVGAFLTAFYMTRQMCYVFFGQNRSENHASSHESTDHHAAAHESPRVMTVPLMVLAFFAITLGFIGTPLWPWFDAYILGHTPDGGVDKLLGALPTMLVSTATVACGIGLAWRLYQGGARIQHAADQDPLETFRPQWFAVLQNRFYVDELYEMSVIAFTRWTGRACDWWDCYIWQGLISAMSMATLGIAWLGRFFDEFAINFGFQAICERFRKSGNRLATLQNGQAQHYLRVIGVALVVLFLFLTWGCRP